MLDSLLPPTPWIVGHRGAAAEAPENTLESFRRALAAGADMVELDLRLTADGALVACHDRDLARTGGSELVVEEAPLAAIRRLDVSGPLAGRGPAHRVPTLDEVLAELPAELPLDLELKRDLAGREPLAAALAAALEGIRRPLLISSFDHPLLEIVRSLLPEVPRAPIDRRDGEALLAAGDRLDAWSLHAHRRLASAELVAAARADGRPLLVYTVNDPAEAARLFDLGVRGVFSDDPGRLRRELAPAADADGGSEREAP